MTIVKIPLQRTVTIAIDKDGNVTHAWQQTAFDVEEDGVKISAGVTDKENLEPADIAAAVPQAAILAQLAELQAKATSDASAAADALAAEKAAANAAAT